MGATRTVRHGGATNGQLSAFVLVPAWQFALTVLTNADRGGELNREVVKWALAHYLGLDEPDPTPRDTADAELQPYAGRYTARGSDLELRVENGRLVVQIIPKGGFPRPDSPAGPTPPPVRAALCGDDQFIVLDEPLQGIRGEFLRDPDGGIAWLRAGGRVHARED